MYIFTLSSLSFIRKKNVLLHNCAGEKSEKVEKKCHNFLVHSIGEKKKNKYIKKEKKTCILDSIFFYANNFEWK